MKNTTKNIGKPIWPTSNEATEDSTITATIDESNEDLETTTAVFTNIELSNDEVVTDVDCKQLRNRTSVSTFEFCNAQGQRQNTLF